MKRRDFLAAAGSVVVVAGASPAAAAIPRQLPDYNMPEEMLPRMVRIKNDFAPYEVHVDPGQYALYWTLPDNQAMRYSVGIARTELYTAGEYYVGARKVWPSWRPSPGMLEREPEKYGKYRDGLPGGLNNPLGSRGLYLFRPGRGDTMLRIHGTNDPRTIGRRVSNGCARLINDQMIDLYDRVPMDTRVVLHPLGGA